MAKQQTFGEKVMAAKSSKRKMAKVILAKKNNAGKISFQEATLDQDQVKNFISKNKN